MYKHADIHVDTITTHTHLASKDEPAYVKGVKAEAVQRVRESVLARHEYHVNLKVYIHTYAIICKSILVFNRYLHIGSLTFLCSLVNAVKTVNAS